MRLDFGSHDGCSDGYALLQAPVFSGCPSCCCKLAGRSLAVALLDAQATTPGGTTTTSPQTALWPVSLDGRCDLTGIHAYLS
jgi:hypothetical protein